MINNLLKFQGCQVTSCCFKDSYPQEINGKEIDGKSIARICRHFKSKECPFIIKEVK